MGFFELFKRAEKNKERERIIAEKSAEYEMLTEELVLIDSIKNHAITKINDLLYKRTHNDKYNRPSYKSKSHSISTAEEVTRINDLKYNLHVVLDELDRLHEFYSEKKTKVFDEIMELRNNINDERQKML